MLYTGAEAVPVPMANSRTIWTVHPTFEPPGLVPLPHSQVPLPEEAAANNRVVLSPGSTVRQFSPETESTGATGGESEHPYAVNVGVAVYLMALPFTMYSLTSVPGLTNWRYEPSRIVRGSVYVLTSLT